jgi:hypothetical protein
VSICFRCNNAYAAGELRTFDAKSPSARELLAFFRLLAPEARRKPIDADG